MDGRERALDDLAAARIVLDQAAERILGLIEDGLNAPPGTDLTPILNELLEACSFNDLAGQRLTRAMNALAPRADARPDAALMTGPGGRGVSQNQADALMALKLPRLSRLP